MNSLTVKTFLKRERNLIIRTASASVLAITTLWVLFFAPLPVQVAVIALIYTALVYEWHSMNQKRPQTILYWGGHSYLFAAIFGLYQLVHTEKSLLLLLILVWSNDVFAYATGRILGGPKLWQKVSPSKTWSGFVGGVVLGTAASWAYNAYIDLAYPLWMLIILSIISHAGDLIESSCKRYYGVKDSSNLIPGHGGFLDRLDSILAVSVAYMILKAFPV